MTSSIVNWVNSGFKGSPAFVQDISNFMLEVTDQTMGQYLEDLGGPFSFICSPFKLDVRVALAISYEQVRSYGKNPEACTLTGALANIENFIDGTQSFVEAGGWDNWLSISANPTSYTPYGNLGAAQAEASARIVNAKGDEMGFLGFGNGFLSSKICETVEGAGSDRENCFVSTPGKVVQDALTFSLESGPRSLVEADEINEIIAAVFAQLTQKAVTGAAGLLGLSGGTGYTYTGVPMTQQVTGSGLTADPEKLLRMMLDAQAIERDYQDLAVSYGPRLIAYALAATDIRRKQPAQDAADEIYDEILDEVDFNLRDLQILIDDFQASQYDPVTGELRVEPIALQDITQEFFGLPLHTAVEVDGKEALWEGLLR